MLLRNILLPRGYVLSADGGHDKECTVSGRSENTLDRPDTSDWIDIAEIFRVHHVSCDKSVHAVGGLPAEEWSAFEFDMVVVETFVKKVAYPFRYLYIHVHVQGIHSRMSYTS